MFLSIILAYFIFKQPIVSDFFLEFEKFHYLGMFLAGVLFSFGFSAPFSIGFFIISQPDNILLASIIAGVGSMLGDIAIFKFVKNSFTEEFNEINNEKIVKTIKKAVRKSTNILVNHYFLYVFAGIIFATPLPDEVGVSMLAGLTTIKQSTLAIMGFIFHAIPIFLILYFSTL